MEGERWSGTRKIPPHNQSKNTLTIAADGLDFGFQLVYFNGTNLNKAMVDFFSVTNDSTPATNNCLHHQLTCNYFFKCLKYLC